MRKRDVTPPEVMEALAKEVAALSLVGTTHLQIASALNISLHRVKIIMKTPEFKQYLQEISDEAMSAAKQIIRKRFSDLAPKAVAVITRKLEEDDLEAVKLVLKGIGIEQDTSQVQDTNIVVQLPGVKHEEIIVPEYKSEDDA